MSVFVGSERRWNNSCISTMGTFSINLFQGSGMDLWRISPSCICTKECNFVRIALTHMWSCLVSKKVSETLGYVFFRKLNKIIYVGVCGIRTKLDPFVHIHNGDILHKSLPGFRKGFMKNITITNMHQRVQLRSDLTNPYVKLFSFKKSIRNPRLSLFPETLG